MMRASSVLHMRLDQAGIVASIGCAVHCLIAPFVILFAPAFGGIWASPQTHLLIALFVLPVAILTMANGYRTHQRAWILGLGITGAGFVLLGTAFPWLEPLWAAGATVAQQDPELAQTTCTTCTNCCPTVTIDETSGEWNWKFPPASWLTMVGGMSLVSAHWGNLRCCKSCKKSKAKVGPFCSG
ncbi:MAG: MerC domain-containing protein [Planctomycetes bacterium]|nr:MerC domain-containing protein [Planctomycetota bacterium]